MINKGIIEPLGLAPNALSPETEPLGYGAALSVLGRARDAHSVQVDFTEDALKNLRTDRRAIRGHPCDPRGLRPLSRRYDEVQTDRTIIASVREVAVVAHHTKLGKIATVRQAAIGRVRRVITDSAVLKTGVSALRERGLEVEVASLD